MGDEPRDLAGSHEVTDAWLRARLPQQATWRDTELRRAAVLCPLLQRDGADHVVLLRRPAHLRQHAGQIGFPGGMSLPGETVEQTARRECREEIGVPDAAVTVLGELGVNSSTTGILVHALVARLAPVTLQPDPHEVAEVMFVPLAELRQPQRWRDGPGSLGEPVAGPPMVLPVPRGPQFAIGEHVLWGLTARFIRDLLVLLSAVK